MHLDYPSTKCETLKLTLNKTLKWNHKWSQQVKKITKTAKYKVRQKLKACETTFLMKSGQIAESIFVSCIEKSRKNLIINN